MRHFCLHKLYLYVYVAITVTYTDILHFPFVQQSWLTPTLTKSPLLFVRRGTEKKIFLESRIKESNTDCCKTVRLVFSFIIINRKWQYTTVIFLVLNVSSLTLLGLLQTRVITVFWYAFPVAAADVTVRINVLLNLYSLTREIKY